VRLLILILLFTGCEEHSVCVKGKMYYCPPNEESDCALVYKTSAKINPELCVVRKDTK